MSDAVEETTCMNKQANAQSGRTRVTSIQAVARVQSTDQVQAKNCVIIDDDSRRHPNATKYNVNKARAYILVCLLRNIEYTAPAADDLLYSQYNQLTVRHHTIRNLSRGFCIVRVVAPNILP